MSMVPVVNFLLVDDIEENLIALEALLQRDGLRLFRARSGPEALELMLTHEFGLALLDVQMPGMDGFELATLMRGSSRTKHIPIIFLTAAGFDDGRKFQGYEAGAVDFMFKPIEPTILKSKCEIFYNLHVQHQELERQRDELQRALSENVRLYDEIVRLNESLEARVEERTGQLLEANEQLQGFTYSIAHDFRQHIRNINTNAEIVLVDGGDEVEPHRHNLRRISEIAKLMSMMSEDLLTYARMRTAPLRRVDIDVTATAREIGSALRNDFPRTKLKVQEGLRVHADRTMFRAVLQNLLDNAFKYSHTVPWPEVEVGHDETGLFVRDNGIGIDMTYAHKLFKPFERLSSRSEFPGTGMGLANVKRIIERHEGEIHVVSKVNEGATVYIQFGA